MRLLPEEHVELAEKSRAQRRQEWKETAIQIARSHGDERPGDVILREAGQRAGRISQAFNEAYHDRESTETVSQGTYSLFNQSGVEILFIEEGAVLTQSRAMRHCDPALRVR
jgi:hypothetical protein